MNTNFPQTEAYRRGEVTSPWLIAQVHTQTHAGSVGDMSIQQAHAICCGAEAIWHSGYGWLLGEIDGEASEYAHRRSGSYLVRNLQTGYASSKEKALAIFWQTIEETRNELIDLPA